MRRMKSFVTISILTVLCIVAIAVFAVVRTKGQDSAGSTANTSGDQWEYMALAGPTTTSFSSSGNPRMKKDSTGGFAREAFVLEQHLDKLGSQGWELVAIGGPPTDPAYYFKRHK